jgi:hypothetical protein
MVDEDTRSAGTGGKQGNVPRKHHYVPVFYQTKFVNDNGLLWVYDRQAHTYKELHPLSICFKKDLYSIKPEGKPVDTRIETKIMSEIDGAASIAIGRLEDGNGLDKDSFASFTLFAALQHQRLPSMDRDMRLMYEQALEEMMRVAFSNTDRARMMMDRYLEESDIDPMVTPESMVAAVRGKHIRAHATETAFLQNMMHMAVEISNVLSRLNMEVLISPDGTGFMLCDSPFALIPAKNTQHIGFLIPGNVKYLPVSRKLCFRASEPGTQRRYRKVARETVRIINHNIAANSERFIMGPEKRQLEAIVERSGSHDADLSPRFVMETLQSDEDGSLTKTSLRPRRYFYPKDGSNLAP